MIKVVISKSGRAGKLQSGAVTPLVVNVVGVAKVMAEQLKETSLNDKRKITFDTGARSYLSERYMELLGKGGVERWRDYAERTKSQKPAPLYINDKSFSWKSSQFWHHILRKDDMTFNRTGGMWAGLRVRNYGAKGAIIEFAGKSEGQQGEWRKAQGRTKAGERRQFKFSSKVSNNLKAWTVFNTRKVLLLLPNTKTQVAFEVAVNQFVAKWVANEVGAVTEGLGEGGLLTAKFLDALK